jgi:hypothetical protein
MCFVDAVVESSKTPLAYGTKIRTTTNNLPEKYNGTIIGVAEWSMILGQTYIVEIPELKEIVGYSACILAERDFEVTES